MSAETHASHTHTPAHMCFVFRSSRDDSTEVKAGAERKIHWKPHGSDSYCSDAVF